MPAVLVNGNPESGAIWRPLLEFLDRADVICLSPPGFGSPVPDGFDVTVTSLRDWLIDELSAIGEPVDLVGHDIGGSTVLTVAMARPDLLSSWASDSLGVFDPDYTWHELAQGWQTPGVGETSVAALMGGPLKSRAARLISLGIPQPVADEIATVQGPQMGRAILSFYRSAAQPAMAELGRNLPAAAARPGLAIIGTDDHHVGTEEMRLHAAARAGAQPAVLTGLSHWWMAQNPALAATTLTSFWASA